MILKINFDQEYYSEGDFICYEIEVENKENYPVPPVQQIK